MGHAPETETSMEWHSMAVEMGKKEKRVDGCVFSCVCVCEPSSQTVVGKGGGRFSSSVSCVVPNGRVAAANAPREQCNPRNAQRPLTYFYLER